MDSKLQQEVFKLGMDLRDLAMKAVDLRILIEN